ncbi:MAG: hypothetical protein GY801_48520, partial [bacterium]|nr:hypothetical protein [bacterium]
MAQSSQQLELVPKPHGNHYLFSDYYLDHRVQTRAEWQNVAIQPLFQEIAQLWEKFTPQQENEAQTEDVLIRPVLRAL